MCGRRLLARSSCVRRPVTPGALVGPAPVVPRLTVPDRLTVPLAESYPEVLTAHHPHRLGLSSGMPVNAHRYVLEVAAGCLRAGRRTTRPTTEWSTVLEVDVNQDDGTPRLDLPIELRMFVVQLVLLVLRMRRPARRISEWSRQSRRNMVRTFATLDWAPFIRGGIAEMVTLTYPGDWQAVAGDGRVIKAHLEAFKLRWERRWGEPPAGVWKLEFQARGAPHFHLYVSRPAVPAVEFMAWLSSAWYEIVDSGDRRHLAAGTGLDRQFAARQGDVRTLVTYFSKHNSKWGEGKGYQNDVPTAFEDVGRFWGVWGLRPDVEAVELTRADYVQVVRMLRKLRRAARSNARRVSAQGGEAGLWTLCSNGWHIGTQVARWLRDERPRRPIRE